MLESLEMMSDGDLLIVGFAAAVMLCLLGAITNAILKESGFGTFVNGVLMLVGAAAGIAARATMQGF